MKAKYLRIPKELMPVTRAFVRFWQQPDGPVEMHLRSLMETVLSPSARSQQDRKNSSPAAANGCAITQRDYKLLRKVELRLHSSFQEIRHKLDRGWVEEPGPLTLTQGDKPWLRQPRLVCRACPAPESGASHPAPVESPPAVGNPFSYLALMRRLLSDADLEEFRHYKVDVGRVRKARRALYREYLRQLDRDLRVAQKVRERAALRSADSELQVMLQENLLCFYHLNRLQTAALLHWLNLPKVDLAQMVQNSLAALEIRLVPAALPA